MDLIFEAALEVTEEVIINGSIALPKSEGRLTKPRYGLP
jgi:hypothetical protein